MANTASRTKAGTGDTECARVTSSAVRCASSNHRAGATRARLLTSRNFGSRANGIFERNGAPSGHRRPAKPHCAPRGALFYKTIAGAITPSPVRAVSNPVTQRGTFGLAGEAEHDVADNWD